MARASTTRTSLLRTRSGRCPRRRRCPRVPTPGDLPDNHLSYAIQWFGFALVFLVGFGAFTWGPGRSGGGTSPEDETGRDMGGVGNAQNEKAAQALAD